MKKEYINPQLEVVMLNTMPLLAGSGNGETFGEGELNGNQGDASQWFDNGDSNEPW